MIQEGPAAGDQTRVTIWCGICNWTRLGGAQVFPRLCLKYCWKASEVIPDGDRIVVVVIAQTGLILLL